MMKHARDIEAEAAAGMRCVIASLPDKERVVAELYTSDEQWAEISQEGERPIITIYPAFSGASWQFDLDTLIYTLEEVRRKLLGDR
jgi:hypothetical protein